jgi:hypothetical protein
MNTKKVYLLGLSLLVVALTSCSQGPKDLKSEIQKANDVFADTKQVAKAMW